MIETAEIRARQREDWNFFAPGWNKWDERLMEYLKPVGERILELAELKDGHSTGRRDLINTKLQAID